MIKDYEAIVKARQNYLEEIEQITEVYNEAWAKLQEENKKARDNAWARRKEAITKAGG